MRNCIFALCCQICDGYVLVYSVGRRSRNRESFRDNFHPILQPLVRLGVNALLPYRSRDVQKRGAPFGTFMAFGYVYLCRDGSGCEIRPLLIL